MSEASASEERRRRLVQLGSAAAFLAIVVVAVLIVISESQTSGGDTSLEGVQQVRRELAGIPQEGMTLGSPAAPVTLVEFGDLQCPACKGFAEEDLPDLIDSKVRSGEARIAFRNYAFLGEESEVAAAAALAAGRQGRGWEFVELFYRNQGIEGSGYVTDSFLAAIAQAAGVSDIDRWNADRRSRRLAVRGDRESTQAAMLGFSGTPSFAIEGPGTRGLQPLDAPTSLGDIEAAIKQAG